MDNEVSLELVQSHIHKTPIDVTDGYTLEFVWKATSFDRMITALRTFAVDETSLSSTLYHKLLGHSNANSSNDKQLNVVIPKKFSVPGLSDLNHSQSSAIKQVLTQPLSLIQG